MGGASLIDPMTVPALTFMWAEDPLWAPPAAGAGVPSWRNSGSVTGDPQQGTSLLRPVFEATGLNGHPSVLFNGTTQFLDFDTANITQGYQILLVAQMLSGSDQTMIGRGGSSGVDGFGVGTSKWQAQYSTALAGGASDLLPHVFHLIVNGNNSAVVVDEVAVAAGQVGANALLRLTLGAGHNGAVPSQFANCRMSLYGVFSIITDLTALRLSLAKRYAIL